MSELTFKSAGVSTREIDLSQPTPVSPRGVPAGVIGTANEGPAFVPVTVASYQEFAKTFGKTDGEKFGPIAVSEYLKNAQALTYIRILGVGDGKKRNPTTGIVTNAGFKVGDKQVGGGGAIAANPNSNSEIGGRTYFLGCFMSQSNGSTIFSDAGIQQVDAKASAEDAIDTTNVGDSDEFTITVPVNAGGSGTAIRVQFIDAPISDPPAGVLRVARDTGPDDETTADNLIAAINGTALQAVARYGSANDGDSTNGIAGIKAKEGSGAKKISIEALNHGVAGNGITIVDTNMATPLGAVSVSGGSGGAIPILRGVLMAANGVVLSLATGSAGGVSAPPPNNIGGNAHAKRLSGSINLANQNFTLQLDGLKGTVDRATQITASFDVQSADYFGNVLNTDPLKIQETGHLLYSSYDIHSSMTSITGSGVVKVGHASNGVSTKSTHEDVAFILTGSNTRGQTSNLGNIPDYEDFQDRFSSAVSPFMMSQNNNDLFRLVALSPGQNISNSFKFSIENLVPGNVSKNEYGSFDIVIRSIKDSDDNKLPIETFRNVNLDPGSDRYISRVIGDNNIFFDFDSNPESQKILVEGSYPNRSKIVRVVVSSKVSNNDIKVDELPVGFRGPNHLVTSGSNLVGIPDTKVFATTDMHRRVVEPPIPYRENLSIGTGLNKKLDNRYYWGIQTTRKIDPSDPNKLGAFDNTFLSFAKYFPTHRIDTTAISVGNNRGKANINGAILDSDRFNKNKFSLLNIKVRTGSDGVADSSQWISASYVRGGYTIEDDENKFRAFKVSDLSKVSNRKYAKFTCFFQGGFDGSNIFDKDKLSFDNAAAKREIDDSSNQGGTAGPTVSAYRKAVDIMGSKSDVDIQLLAIPGARHASITDYAISSMENRFDAVYIMDIEERDQLNNVITSSASQISSVTNTVTSFKNRGLDSSFAAAYYPDVNIVDPSTQAIVQVPPSVAVLGAYSLNDKLGHPWFAPAGFARGALSAVDNTSVLLNRDNLDELYEADINPIASFPGSGVTIWGQKTLLQNQSALDRVNVRRLLVDVRRKVRNIANTLLFEPNREETLEKFSALVNPIMQRIQDLSGVERYKVVIDTSTTTQADVENNTIRGKIYLQPTRTAEFVALDFVVTNAGSNLL